MSAGSSAGDEAARLRAQAAPRGLRRRVLAVFGADRQGQRAAAAAHAWEAGEKGEQMTAALLKPLAAEGWWGWYDRRLEGAHSANADHVLISPEARVFLVDSKLWHRRATVHVVGGELRHGGEDRSKAIRSVRFEASLLYRSLTRGAQMEVPVTPIVAVHNAPVAGGGFAVQGVSVIPASHLVSLLRAAAGRPDPGRVRALAVVADRVLARYREPG